MKRSPETQEAVGKQNTHNSHSGPVVFRRFPHFSALSNSTFCHFLPSLVFLFYFYFYVGAEIYIWARVAFPQAGHVGPRGCVDELWDEKAFRRLFSPGEDPVLGSKLAFFPFLLQRNQG